MTKNDILISLGCLGACFELGRTIQGIRLRRLKRELANQKAEHDLLVAEKEWLEEEARHWRAMTDIYEEIVKEGEEQRKQFETDIEQLKRKVRRICDDANLKLENGEIVYANDLADQFVEAQD